jgi:hypothetical protein
MRIPLHYLVKVNVITVVFSMRNTKLTGAVKLSEDRRIVVMSRLRTVHNINSKFSDEKLEDSLDF